MIPIKMKIEPKKKNKIPFLISGVIYEVDGSRVWRKQGSDWNGVCNDAYSPDGNYIAVASFIADAVELMKVSDGSRVWRKTGSDWDGARGVAYSPDGNYIVVASSDADAIELID